jgi:hypothetical protein
MLKEFDFNTKFCLFCVATTSECFSFFSSYQRIFFIVNEHKLQQQLPLPITFFFTSSESCIHSYDNVFNELPKRNTNTNTSTTTNSNKLLSTI